MVIEQVKPKLYKVAKKTPQDGLKVTVEEPTLINCPDDCSCSSVCDKTMELSIEKMVVHVAARSIKKL